MKVYNESGCSSAKSILEQENRYYPVGDTYEPGDHYPANGDWVYYRDTSKPVDPSRPADHVGYVLGTQTGNMLATIERPTGAVTRYRSSWCRSAARQPDRP